MTREQAIDALSALVSTIDEDACSCGTRSYIGEGHDSACPLTYIDDAADAIQVLTGEQQ